MKRKSNGLWALCCCILLFSVVTINPARASATEWISWDADVDWDGDMETVRYTIDELSAWASWCHLFLTAGHTGSTVEPHPPCMGIENLREVVYYDSVLVLDEGYYHSTSGLQNRLGTKTTYSILGAVITEWSAGEYLLRRTVIFTSPTEGLCPIKYEIYRLERLIGEVGFAVLWNYENRTGIPWDSRLYIRQKMIGYFNAHAGQYAGIIDPALYFQISYTCDDSMKEIDDHSLIVWSGATPNDFLRHQPIPIQYNNFRWSPLWPFVHNQVSGSAAIWGVVHLPVPSDISVETGYIDGGTFHGVGPEGLYPQLAYAKYNP